jgi:O-antigen/teichoic acid export membrane protein
VLLVVAGAALLPFLAVSIPVGAAVLAATVPLIRGTRALMPRFSWARWRPLLARILPFSLAIAASALYFRVSVLLVSAISTKAQLGYFSASFRAIEVLTIVPSLLANAALPIFSRAAHEDHERLGYAVGRVFEVALVLGAWVAVSIAVGSRLVMDVIGGAAFHPAAPVLAFQGVALGALFVGMVWANALLSLGLYRQILLFTLGALAFHAAIVSVLVSADGARGAAIGTAITELLSATVGALILSHGRPQLRPSLRTVPRVALATALGLVPLALTGLPVIVRLVISTVLFGATVVATRALPTEAKAVLPDAVSRRL